MAVTFRDTVRSYGVGWLLALLVLLAAFVLFITGRMDGVSAAMFAGLALAIILGG